MNSEPIQNGSIKQLKSKIKKFRNNFNNTHGRMPNQSDIKARPNILTLYSQLRSLVQPPKKKIIKDRKSVTNNVMHVQNSENNGISKGWVRRKDLEKPKFDEMNNNSKQHNINLHGKKKTKYSKFDGFDGNVLRRASGSVTREYAKNKKRKESSDSISTSVSSTPSFLLSNSINSMNSGYVDNKNQNNITLNNNNNKKINKNILAGRNQKRIKLLDGSVSFKIKRINKPTNRNKSNVNQNNINQRLRGVGRLNVNKDATMRREHCLLLPVITAAISNNTTTKTTTFIPKEQHRVIDTNVAKDNATKEKKNNEDITMKANTEVEHDGNVTSNSLIQAKATVSFLPPPPPPPPPPPISLARHSKVPGFKQSTKKVNSSAISSTSSSSSFSLGDVKKKSSSKAKNNANNQISENYVRIDLKKRWRGKKKLGSGKFRAHKEFMRKRAENTENKDTDRKNSRLMNSGRDIIDDLLELSEERQDSNGSNDDKSNVPKCPGHGYPCIIKKVKKSGKNKGREFYVCPLDRKQQCKCFFWVDDSVAIAMQEFYGNDTKEEQRAKRIESEKRKLLQLTVKELKIRLSRRNLPIKGKKDELIDRLVKSICEITTTAAQANGLNANGDIYNSNNNSYSSSSDEDLEEDDSGMESDDSLELIEATPALPPPSNVVNTKYQNSASNNSIVRRRLHELLEEKYGFKSYRKGQLWGIERTLKGESSLVVLPTGGGKSLIYQVAAMMSDGLTLVVSPLLSLMRDQLEHLPHGLHGAALNSTMGKVEIARVLRDLRERTLKVLFVSPERLFNASFQRLLGKPGLMPPISIAVIDEAHCISEWSHNFRSSYMRLNQVLRGSDDISLNAKCVLALTATATPPVVKHIATSLQLPEDGVLLESWKRPNLSLNVEKDTDKYQMLNKLLKSTIFVKMKKNNNKKSVSNNRYQGFRETQTLNSIIVYVFRQYDANNVAQFLKQQGFSAAAYHAGMSWNDREKVQSAFISGRTKIMVATVAFGMGLDKSDVRGVIHFHLPKSIENYVQEVGRAGRDGKESHCYLLLHDADFIKNHSLAHADSIDSIQVRKLLKCVFEKHECEKSSSGFSKRRTVCIIEDQMSKKIDMKANIMETLLCHLTLPPYNLLELLPNACITCVVTCKFSIEKIKNESTNCRKIFELSKLKTTVIDQRNGYDKGSGVYEVNVPDVAYQTNIPEIEVRRVLDDLRHRNFITTTWTDRSFRCIPKKNIHLSPELYDKLCDFLWKKTSIFEESLRTKAETMYIVARNELSNDIISKYFSGNTKELLDTFREHEAMIPFDKAKVPLLRADVHVLLRDQRLKEKKVLATPRAITRIFHGISSPAFPYIDFKGSVFWGRHLSIEFNVLLGHVKEIITNLKTLSKK